jgi:hypothetical protein
MRGNAAGQQRQGSHRACGGWRHAAQHGTAQHMARGQTSHTQAHTRLTQLLESSHALGRTPPLPGGGRVESPSPDVFIGRLPWRGRG